MGHQETECLVQFGNMQNNWPRAGFEPTSPAAEFRTLGAKRSTYRWKDLKSLTRAVLEPTTSNNLSHA